MLIDFFLHLRERKLPVSTKEFLTLLEALQAGLARHSLDDFYFLARSCLVKDEAHFDRFDQAFGEYFKGVQAIPGLDVDLPDEWLKATMKRHLSPADKAKLEKLGFKSYTQDVESPSGKRTQQEPPPVIGAGVHAPRIHQLVAFEPAAADPSAHS